MMEQSSLITLLLLPLSTLGQLPPYKFYNEALITINHIRDLHNAQPVAYNASSLGGEAVLALQELINHIDTAGTSLADAFKEPLALDEHPTYRYIAGVLPVEEYQKLRDGNTLYGGILARYVYITEYPFMDFQQFDERTAHMSQLIWKATSEFAMTNGTTSSAPPAQNYFVIIYVFGPYGNFGDTPVYLKNVEKPKDNKFDYSHWRDDGRILKYPVNVKRAEGSQNPDDTAGRAWYSIEEYF